MDDATDEVLRVVPLTREARTELENALAVQRERFIAKFGREPGPDDDIFFDLDEDKLREDTADAMRAAGISPTLIVGDLCARCQIRGTLSRGPVYRRANA